MSGQKRPASVPALTGKQRAVRFNALQVATSPTDDSTFPAENQGKSDALAQLFWEVKRLSAIARLLEYECENG